MYVHISPQNIFSITILPLWPSSLTPTWTKYHTIHHEIITETQTKLLQEYLATIRFQWMSSHHCVGHSTFHLIHLVLRNNWFRQPALQGAPTQPANKSSSKLPWGIWLLEVAGEGGIDTAPHPTVTGNQKEKWQLKNLNCWAKQVWRGSRE